MRFAAHLMCVSSPFGIMSSRHCAFLPLNVSERAHRWPGHRPALFRVSDWVALGSSVRDCGGPAPVWTRLLFLGSQCTDAWSLIGRRLSEETEASGTRHDSLSLPCRLEQGFCLSRVPLTVRSPFWMFLTLTVTLIFTLSCSPTRKQFLFHSLSRWLHALSPFQQYYIFTFSGKLGGWISHNLGR